jgi:hypothetical protein
MSAFEQPVHNALAEHTVNQPQDRDSAANKAMLASFAHNFSDALEGAGFRLDRDPDYLEQYKLDIVVTRIQKIHAHVNLGVRLHTLTDDLDRQEEFLETARRGVVHKSIYIEVDEKTIGTGAFPVAMSACMSFLFDRRYSQFKCIGLKVFEDCTFHYFDIEENVRRLRRDAQHMSHRIGQDLGGHIIAYFTDKGFGFIEAEKDQKFFFHIANVIDDDLRVQLPTYQPGELIPVIFKYGGSDGKKYPKAIDVLLEDDFEDDEIDDLDDLDDIDDGDY